MCACVRLSAEQRDYKGKSDTVPDKELIGEYVKRTRIRRGHFNMKSTWIKGSWDTSQNTREDKTPGTGGKMILEAS